jgi:hypothetical protein
LNDDFGRFVRARYGQDILWRKLAHRSSPFTRVTTLARSL